MFNSAHNLAAMKTQQGLLIDSV